MKRSLSIYGRPTLPILFACVGEDLFSERGNQLVVGNLYSFWVVGCQGLRWWCINTLGQRWNTRVIIVPNSPRVTGGPYQYINHPNYVSRSLRRNIYLGSSIMDHRNMLYSIKCCLMVVRIRCENEALSKLLNSEV